MSILFEVTDQSVKTSLAELPTKMMDYAFEVMLKQAELIKGLAQVYCPVETGSLRDSIRVERGGENKQWRQIKVRMGGYVTNPKTGKKVNYAGFQEFGTKFIVAKLFLTQAVNEVQPTIAGMIETNVVRGVQE